MLEFMLSMLGIFAFNVLANSVGTLKTMFTSRNLVMPAYVVTGVDAFISYVIIGQIASQNDYRFAIAFSLGKVAGVWVARQIDNKLAFGTLEVDVFIADKDIMKEMADTLRKNKFYVTPTVTWGLDGEKQYKVEVTLARKNYEDMKNVIKQFIKNPAMKIREVDRTEGKIDMIIH